MTSSPGMTLNSTGLGIGTSPSANLHVAGNILATDIQLSGSLNFGIQNVASHIALSDNSLILADSSYSDLTLSLPDADTSVGRTYVIKKVSALGNVTIKGNFIDDDDIVVLEHGQRGVLNLISMGGERWVILNVSGYSSRGQVLFRDSFNETLSALISDPAGRSHGWLAHAVKYSITNNSSANVVVSAGQLDWVGDNPTFRGEVHAPGQQSLTFRTTPDGATHFNWVSYLIGKDYEISFSYHTAWSHPLTFGLSDTPQSGAWNAWQHTTYDLSFGSYGNEWRTGEDGNLSTYTGATHNTSYEVCIKIYENGGNADIYINGSFLAKKTIDFENSGRYLSFGAAHNYGGHLDNLVIRLLP